ncbi:MAG: cadherin domain-containing protein, partial [Burkholderiaceae bacterium]
DPTANTLTINVTPVNDTPWIISPAAASGPENGLDLVRVEAVDLDADALRYVIAGGADAAHFVLDETSGRLRWAQAPDFERARDADGDNVYVLEIEARDTTGAVARQRMAIRVLDVNEAPYVIGPSELSVERASAMAGLLATVLAADPDANSHLSYALLDDAGGRFAMDPRSGALRVVDVARIDFATPTRYELRVRVVDESGLSGEGRLSVLTVRAGADIAPPVPDPGLPPVVPPKPEISKPPSVLVPVEPALPAAPAIVPGEGAGAHAPLPLAPEISGLSLVGAYEPLVSVFRTGLGTDTESNAGRRGSNAGEAGWLSELEAWRGTQGASYERVGLGSESESELRGRRSAHDAAEPVARSSPSEIDILRDVQVGGGLVLVAGFVWWASGLGLFATLLVGTPTLRHVDLLPILAGRRDEDDGDDDNDDDDGYDSVPGRAEAASWVNDLRPDSAKEPGI